MVSDKMAKAGLDSWAQFGKHQRDHKRVAQDIVGAAWHTFDAEDSDTWPKSDYAPSENQWLVTFGDGDVYMISFDCNEHYWNKFVTAYADPADLMPQREDE